MRSDQITVIPTSTEEIVGRRHEMIQTKNATEFRKRRALISHLQVPLSHPVSFPMGNSYSVTGEPSHSNDLPNVFLDTPSWLDFL